ncbi:MULTISPECIES: hypothetical protein [unclassified Microcoleus]|uniref:hypothetical protein n=1 Tax=unclassified Microcoleus TaxID=2642155 RepID=UPI002FD4E7F1
MALIKCSECDGKVASTATNCPHCGAPVGGKRATQIEGANALILLGSCVVGLFLGVFLSRFASEDQINLRVALGFAGLIAPPAAALVWSSRRQK